jgi:hypothetical protein
MRNSIIIFLFFSTIPVLAQEPISHELEFIQHLVNQEEYGDAIYYINSRFNQEYPMPIRDSLNYFKGWSYYSIKELEQSAFSLLQVSNNSSYFLKSRFFAAYNYSYLGIISVTDQILKNLDVPENLKTLKSFELSGNSLLKRDLPEFNSYFKKIETSGEFSFNLEKEKFLKYSLEIENHKNKSMVVGGLMSAIIPGSGKIYAWKTGEGISSFIIVAASGVTAYENYHKLGIKHAKTILFGSLFVVLYIGNIYGTVFSVKLANEEFNHEMDNKILFNMHIPLRNIFN